MKFKLFFLVLCFFGVYLFEKNKPQNFLVFCNVGQGDGALLMSDNMKVLIDVGPPNKQILTCMERYLPFWDKTIDIVMISHWDSDHSGGLPDILKYYKVKNVFCSSYESKNVEQKNCTKKLKNNDMVSMGKTKFEILSSGQENGNNEKKKIDDNENSLVEILNYKDKRILFTGDITTETEERLVWRKILSGKIDILKVSHHGSKSATGESLLHEIKPSVAIVSVGKNSFGHPTEETLGRLKENGVKIRRTDTEGDIIIKL